MSSGASATSTTSAASLSSGASATSTTSFGSSGSTGSSGTTGTTGGLGGTSGGDFGGLIGIGGSFGGVGGVGGTSTGGGGGTLGGSAPKPSAAPAGKGDCDTTSDKLKRPCIPLVQPLGDKNVLSVLPGAGTFVSYFDQAASLILTIAIGFSVLWILIGSYLVMISGSDGGKRGTGKSMITWALVGLIIVNFAGFFLRTLNNMFFV